MRTYRGGVALAGLLVLTGCAAPPAGGDVPLESPPPVVISMPDGDLDLSAWTYCWSPAGSGGACADGAPPEEPASVGEPPAVDFSFASPGWDFLATFTEHTDAACPRSLTTTATRTGETTFRMEPIGLAGPWTVDLFGRGPEGDAVTTFEWTTPADGPVEVGVEGSVIVLANHDGAVDSYGVELAITGLAVTPAAAAAAVTVSNAAGEAVTIKIPWQHDDGYCRAGELWFSADPNAGKPAIELADQGEVSYAVDLVLDGEIYTGTGVWSLDLPSEDSLAVELEWTPALPAYDPGQTPSDDS